MEKTKTIILEDPYQFATVDTSNAFFSDLDGQAGVGEIEVSFSDSPSEDNRVHLWSCEYSEYSGTPMGFEIALRY